MPRPPLLSAAPDELLVDRAADGDAAAFTVLMRRYGPQLRAYAVRLVAVRADADDVLQETFITAWQQLPALREGAAVRAWLYRIASSKAAAANRARPLTHELEPDVVDALHSTPSSEETVIGRSRVTALAAALAELPELQRRVWLMREAGGQSYDEIADDLDISVSTVRGLLARARRTLSTLEEVQG